MKPFTMLAIVYSALTAGFLCSTLVEANIIHMNGFEQPHPDSRVFVDIARTSSGVCALNKQGNIRCATRPDRKNLPALIYGDFIDLAAYEGGICARTPADKVSCFGQVSNAPLPDAAFETAIKGTSGFAEDMQVDLCAPNASGDTYVCINDTPGHSPISDFVSLLGSPLEDQCSTLTAGGLACYKSGREQTMATSRVYVQVAASPEYVCGLADDGVAECFERSTGQQVKPTADEPLDNLTAIQGLNDFYAFCGIRTGGRVACWDFVISGSISTSRMATQLSISQGSVCGLDLEQRPFCFGHGLEGEGRPPAGNSWSRVESAGSTVSWVRDDGPSALFGEFTSGQRDFSSFANSALMGMPRDSAACGISGEEFVCGYGSDDMGVPAGPWKQISYTAYFSRSWCGVRSGGTLECRSALPDSKLPDVPAGSYRAVALVAAYWRTPNETAWALDNDGRLTCWDSDGTCSAPVDTNFVHLWSDGSTAWAQRSNGETVPLFGGSRVSSEVFVRYEGEFGVRADGTIGSWIEPALAQPAGVFVDVVPITSLTLGPGPESVDATACGLRSTGDIECWNHEGNTLVPLIEVAGSFRRLHGTTSLLFATDADDRSHIFGNNGFGNSLVTFSELTATRSNQCGIGATYAACLGWSFRDVDPQPVPADPGYSGLHASSSFYCLVDPQDQAVCWTSSNLPASFVFPETNDWRMVRAAAGHACAVTSAGRKVECVGQHNFGGSAQFPFGDKDESEDILDMATSEFGTCQIKGNGSIECMGPWGFDSGPEPAEGWKRIELTTWTDLACLISEGDELSCYQRGTPWNKVFSAPGAWSDVAITATAICAVSTTNEGRCWGIEQQMDSW